jgi:hypothetical protein
VAAKQLASDVRVGIRCTCRRLHHDRHHHVGEARRLEKQLNLTHTHLSEPLLNLKGRIGGDQHVDWAGRLPAVATGYFPL